MIVFVGRDPGPKNNLLSLYQHALRKGYEARFVDLFGARELNGFRAALPHDVVKLMVCGSSENRAEWKWVREAKQAGIRTALLFDVGAGSVRRIDPADRPDLFLVMSEASAAELRKIGVPAELIRVTGSPHLESLRLRAVQKTPDVRQHYGLDPGHVILSLFLSADETEPASWEIMVREALTTVHELLTKSCLQDWILIVRPHPRNSKGQLKVVDEICRSLSGVRLDASITIDTPSVLSASLFSLSLASTVSLESLILGTPSAFFQIGWTYEELDWLYANLDCVPRLRTSEEFQAFVSGVVADRAAMIPRDVPSHEGAILRSWDSLCELVDPDRFEQAASGGALR
jgi:hypothetical protein